VVSQNGSTVVKAGQPLLFDAHGSFTGTNAGP
jgi:hypothetical protein